MSAGVPGVGGITAASIRVPIVVDLAKWGADMAKARKEAEKGAGGGAPGAPGSPGAGAEKTIRARLDVAAKALYILRTAYQATRKIVNEITASVGRLAELRGVGDPVTGSFTRMQASVTRAWDAMVLGVLKSDVVRGALGAVTEAMQGVARWAETLGTRIDVWAKENAASVAYFAGILRGTIEFVISLPSMVTNVFKLVAGSIAYVAGEIASFLGDLGEGLATVFDAVGMESAAKAVRRLSSETKSFGDALADLAAPDVVAAADALQASFNGIGQAAIDMEKKIAAVIADTVPGKNATLGDPMFGDRGSMVVAAMEDISRRVGDSWEAATDRISRLFDDLSKDSRFNDSEAGLLVGSARLLDGFGALGRQAELAFGKSSKAAVIASTAIIATQGLEATVNGMMQLGKAQSKLSTEPGAAAAHLASSATFFAAAGLAGARAFGAFGGAGGASGRSSRDTSLDNRGSVSDSVEKAPVVVLLHIEGNVLGSEEYLRDQLVPRMRRMVEEGGVTFTASDLTNNGRV